jgi:hypothetical protein
MRSIGTARTALRRRSLGVNEVKLQNVIGDADVLAWPPLDLRYPLPPVEKTPILAGEILIQDRSVRDLQTRVIVRHPLSIEHDLLLGPRPMVTLAPAGNAREFLSAGLSLEYQETRACFAPPAPSIPPPPYQSPQ